jgi:hypothetical protein
MDRELREVSDVTEEDLAAAVEVMEGWYPEGSIDWEDFWDRLEHAIGDVDLGTDLLSPALQHIRRHVLKVRRTG